MGQSHNAIPCMTRITLEHVFERRNAQYALHVLLPKKKQIPKQIKSSCNLLFQASSQALKDLLEAADDITAFTGTVSFSEAMIPALLFNTPLCLVCQIAFPTHFRDHELGVPQVTRSTGSSLAAHL